MSSAVCCGCQFVATSPQAPELDVAATMYVSNIHRRVYWALTIGVEDGGQGEGQCPLKFGKIFSVNYYVKFGHFSGKNHVKFGNFVNFSGKHHKNSGILKFFRARIM